MDKDPLRRRRDRIKPLLAVALAGEPWKAALDGDDLPPPVLAACIASLGGRFNPHWHLWTTPARLKDGTAAMVAAISAAPPHSPWPFLDAIGRAITGADWSAVCIALQPYRAAWLARPLPTPSAMEPMYVEALAEVAAARDTTAESLWLSVMLSGRPMKATASAARCMIVQHFRRQLETAERSARPRRPHLRLATTTHATL